ncbi:MAG: hypothetical protein ACE5GQ_05960 [Nitrospinales bacterium]
MTELISLILGLALLYLKRRPLPEQQQWKNDVEQFEKALATGDGGRIADLFDQLRREAGAGYRGGPDGENAPERQL